MCRTLGSLPDQLPDLYSSKYKWEDRDPESEAIAISTCRPVWRAVTTVTLSEFFSCRD